MYNPTTNSWTRKADLPGQAPYATEVVINGRLYVVGSRLFRYDPGTNKWSELASAPVPAQDAAVGVIGGRIYMAGGTENLSSFPTNQV